MLDGVSASMDTCLEPRENTNVHVRALHEVCLLLGGKHQLAAYLGVSESIITRWLSDATPPDTIFLRCIDLLEASGRRMQV